MEFASRKRVAPVDDDLYQQRCDRLCMIERVFQLLLDHVADHAAGFRTEHIQRIGFVRLVGRALQCQKAHLRAVAMGDDQTVTGLDDAGQRLRRDPAHLQEHDHPGLRHHAQQPLRRANRSPALPYIHSPPHHLSDTGHCRVPRL